MNPVRNAWRIIPRIIQRGIEKKPVNSSTEIRLTRLCTQRCRQCGVYERTTDPPTMSRDQARTILERLESYGAHIGFISGGEATLVPHLDRVLLESKRVFTLSTTLVTGLVNRSGIIYRIAEVALDNGIHIQTSMDGLGGLGDDLRGVDRFSDTVLEHMEWIARRRSRPGPLLYANVVLNALNLKQIPAILDRVQSAGWKATIGMYHTLTETTRSDEDLRLTSGPALDGVIRYLDDHPGILNLNAYIRGIPGYVAGQAPGFCAFADSPVLATRTTVMEDGSVHLCYGEPVGNLLEESLDSIFSGDAYRRRLEDYRRCPGCWTTCYAQRYLLLHPRSLQEFLDAVDKVRGLRKKA